MKNNSASVISAFSLRREKALQEYIDKLDKELSAQIRNHLLQLFRKAYKVDKGLESVKAGGMGTACAFGKIYCKYEDGSEGEIEAYHWAEDFCGKIKPETRALLLAVSEYDGLICNKELTELPYIDDITAEEIEAEKRGHKRRAK